MTRTVSVGGLSDYTLAGWKTFSLQDVHSLEVADISPVFVNTSGDFHLKTGSPAIDKGTSTVSPSDDLDGNSRPSGAGIDIGAYEWRPGEGTEDFLHENNIRIFPNPSHGHARILFPKTGNYFISVTGTDGQNAGSYFIKNNDFFDLELVHFTPGVYFISVFLTDESVSYHEKIVLAF